MLQAVSGHGRAVGLLKSDDAVRMTSVGHIAVLALELEGLCLKSQR